MVRACHAASAGLTTQAFGFRSFFTCLRSGVTWRQRTTSPAARPIGWWALLILLQHYSVSLALSRPNICRVILSWVNTLRQSNLTSTVSVGAWMSAMTWCAWYVISATSTFATTCRTKFTGSTSPTCLRPRPRRYGTTCIMPANSTPCSQNSGRPSPLRNSMTWRVIGMKSTTSPIPRSTRIY